MRRAVLFDIDGTLVDSTYVHATTWTSALREQGVTIPCARVHRGIGMGADRMLAWLLGDEAADRLGPSARTRQRELFLDQADGLAPLPGARELITHLVERGTIVVLASSASPPERDALLQVLDLPVEVAAITDAGDVEHSKPHPDLLDIALARVDADRRGSVMVGDARWDMEAAQRAGTVGVGVMTGGLCAEELTSAGAQAVYQDLLALLESLNASPLGPLT
jgi:HAD superfamily hydrolase (TIGR01509 family)